MADLRRTKRLPPGNTNRYLVLTTGLPITEWRDRKPTFSTLRSPGELGKASAFRL